MRSRPAPLLEVDRTNWHTPWVHLKYYSFHPQIFPAMIRDVSRDAGPGSWVHVYDKEGRLFGAGLWNDRSRVPLRILHHGTEPVGEDMLVFLLDRALDLRLNLLRLPAETDAYRVIHSDGDGLSGLIVDRFADVLSVQVHSLGIWQRLPKLLAHLHQRLGTTRTVLEVDPSVMRNEGIRPGEISSDDVRTVKVKEHGVRYEVDFGSGHKTGFFCDQRDNRRKLAGWVKDRRVLDLCCYTGGFSISARVTGAAAEVTAVDLDEKAILQAKRNANLNNARINWVHCDAYSFARQMRKDGKKFEVVILDPPKLVFSQEEEEDGLRKYEDLNILGISITEPGGLLVTCSCSGQLAAEEFERIVVRAGHKIDRKLQILDRTGAGLDHPVMSNCPEGRYLKVIWARVW
ncbi:MAG: class I SAM-dependent rRNA methyltransferase [Verrucomicrobia bacterium]|nr:class I SAM-dependent rRNA methyltransferase [Verrucomicrobiota bacterium]